MIKYTRIFAKLRGFQEIPKLLIIFNEQKTPPEEGYVNAQFMSENYIVTVNSPIKPSLISKRRPLACFNVLYPLDLCQKSVPLNEGNI